MSNTMAVTQKPAYGIDTNDISTRQNISVIGDLGLIGNSDLTYEQILYLPLKRIIDMIASLVGLIFCLPIFFVVAAAIKLDSPGPVFFRQKRAGINGSYFSIFKFRSMVIEAENIKDSLYAMNENDGPFFKMKNDPRVTRVGKFIRKYSIDELPQLINVFLGHMSLVGPRPALPNEIQQYTQSQLKNLSVVPGITCFWQISGRSDSSGNRLDLDTKYLNEFNFFTDLWILLKTPMAVIKAKGAC